MEHKILEIMFTEEAPESVFEIGCANGGLLKDLKDNYPNLKVGGMEISESIIKAKELFPEQADNFILRDLNDPWPVPDKSYDIVFSVGVLMYMFDPLPVLKEMLRVAKNKIIIAEYHHQEVGPFGQMTRAYMDNGKIYMGIIRNYLSLFQLLNIPLSCTIQETNGDKTIIKCTIQK